MAGGKSKSKASKKKIAAEATTSAPQPFPYLDGSFLEFGSEEELSRFITHFSKRPISPPRVLPERYPQQKGYHDLDNQLKESVVIRELGITNLVRHSGTTTIHSAPPEKRLLLYILTRILRPRDGSHTCLFNEDLKAVHAITHGASINWAKYVMIHMADCASITNERSLPYAFLIMDLIVGPDTKMTKLWIIQDSTFRKNGINYVPPPFDSTILGQNYEGEDEEDDSHAPSSSPEEADFEDAVDGNPMDVEDDEDDENEDDDTEDEDAAA
ncbi:unnamed protein product [Cuscuta campestris]|uniref:Uncharacterized protein n=1 Tax=Cuscuta campestris TaxID=132261 RepID=A0A484KU00_9ASTE|nr:unnamed protein product [Cuscuta campestris]